MEEYRKRDYAIIMLFLNWGIPCLSELASMDIDKIKDNDNPSPLLEKEIKKEQFFLNEACVSAIEDYLEITTSKFKKTAKLCLEVKEK